MTECPGCGGPLADDDSACPACGLSIGGPTPVEEAAPAPEEPAAEAVPSVSPQADEEPGKLCPDCGTLNPVEAQFCVQCRHAFNERATFFGMSWLVVPALIAVVLIVAAVTAFSFGFIAVGPKDTTTVNNTSAISGANGTAHDVLNQSRNVSHRNATEVVGARNNTTAPNITTPTVTPTRTVDPNSTPWNGAVGAGVDHPEGGTHFVDDSRELQLRQKAAKATPTPVSPLGVGDGSGHATGPLSWVGTGNWSPGFVSLPAGDAQVVLLSQGTTAFIQVDEAGTQAGFGVFLPPGGQYTVPVPQAGSYVFAVGTANATDSWSATILLPGSGGQTAAPPVSTPATQILSFAGTGGGSPGSFNLSPGTVHVALNADQMTMAYIKDPWGVTLSTAVAGPYAGGSTAAITQTGTYRLEVWGTGTWTATVTWTGTPAAGAATLPTVNPAAIVPTLTPWNATATPGTIVTTASVVTTPPVTIVTTVPTITLIPTTTDTTSPQQPLSWSGNGTKSTPSFDLQTGVYRISAELGKTLRIHLLDSKGTLIDGTINLGYSGKLAPNLLL